jgi:hypothetical protein
VKPAATSRYLSPGAVARLLGVRDKQGRDVEMIALRHPPSPSRSHLATRSAQQIRGSSAGRSPQDLLDRCS